MGIFPGARLVVHASLRRVGWLEHGPQTLGHALMDAVGGQGLLVMPSFNHGAPFSSAGPGYYDPKSTPSTSGALSDWFWRQPETYRSLHPTHPFAAWGRGADSLLRDSEVGRTMGRNSPLVRLWQRGGSVLTIGTHHRTTTAKHVAELWEGARCLGEKGDEFVVLVPKNELLKTSFRYRTRPCPLTDELDHLDRHVDAVGVSHHGWVGCAHATLTSLGDFIDATRDLLRTGVGTAGPCRTCSVRPKEESEGQW